MKKKTILVQLVDLISDYIVAGIDIYVDTTSEVKTIAVRNPQNGHAVKFSFKVPYIGVCQIGKWEETPQPVYEPED